MKKNKDIKQRQGLGICSTQQKPQYEKSKQSNKQINLLAFILGNSNPSNASINKTNKVSKNLIINSAMFWDTKKRIQKIKSLFLNNLNLLEFDSNQDFKVEQLVQIQLLNLQKNKIIHLHPIANLDTLVSLNLNHNKIYDLSPLSKLTILSQLYASFNQINDITPLKHCQQLKKINFYSNKISKEQQTFRIISQLEKLQEFDIQQNPANTQYLNQVLNTLNLKKINGEIVTSKTKNISNSQIFNSTFSKGLTTSNIYFNKNPSMLATKMTLYNFQKKDEITKKEQTLKKLELHYNQIDEQFQMQIQKNVKIKNNYQKLSEKLKQKQCAHQDQVFKKQQIKTLKRKVKAMKQNLFTKTKKGDLLRKLFQLQTIYKVSKDNKNYNQKEEILLLNKIQQLQNKKQLIWHRKFQSDEVVIISRHEERDQKYLNQEDEIHDMLENIDQSIDNIKSDLQYFV